MLFSDLDFDQCLILSICLLWTDQTNGLKNSKSWFLCTFSKKKILLNNFEFANREGHIRQFSFSITGSVIFTPERRVVMWCAVDTGQKI